MKQPTLGIPRLSRMRVAAIGALIVGAVGVFALPSAQAAGGTATCQAAQAEVFFQAGDIIFVDEGVETDVVVAPDSNGTNTGGIGPLDVGDPGLLLAFAGVLACEATRADEGLSAEGSVTELFVTSVLGDLVSAELIRSAVDCPADRSMPTTAETEVAGLEIFGEPFSLEAGEQINETFDIDVPEIGFTGTVTVVAGSEADTTDDTASATGLVLSVTIDGTAGSPLEDVVGSVEIRLAETFCERPDLIVQPTEPTVPPTEPTASSPPPPPMTASPPTEPTAPPTEPTAPPTEPTGPVVTLPPTR